MPQLDSNTFIYQYFGVLFLLLSVYFVLSYIVLPILLRLILIRNLFLSTRQTLTDLTTTVSNNYQQLVNFKHSPRDANLIDNLVVNFTTNLNNWLKLVVFSLLINDTKKLNQINTVSFYSNVINYLVLFLLIELEENE